MKITFVFCFVETKLMFKCRLVKLPFSILSFGVSTIQISSLWTSPGVHNILLTESHLFESLKVCFQQSMGVYCWFYEVVDVLYKIVLSVDLVRRFVKVSKIILVTQQVGWFVSRFVSFVRVYMLHSSLTLSLGNISRISRFLQISK